LWNRSRSRNGCRGEGRNQESEARSQKPAVRSQETEERREEREERREKRGERREKREEGREMVLAIPGRRVDRGASRQVEPAAD
jgi:hypothetical protein